MRRIARVVPGYAALFMALMAVLIDSPPLFYMATAMIATIVACRIQASLSVRGLRLERTTPPASHVGELVTVSLAVWSEHRMKRPLIQVLDHLPPRLKAADRTPSVPIAPSFDQPIQTRYSFRPMRRGIFRWSDVEVIGTDALGLVTTSKIYTTEPTELVVYPAKFAVSLALKPVSGTGGMTDAEAGKYRGSGLEPRGVREYVPGDPQRHVHWPSSARHGSLMVKEFESGAELSASFLIQLEKGTEVGEMLTTLEAMCGHAVFLAESFFKLGASVQFPLLNDRAVPGMAAHERLRQINELLAQVHADHEDSLSTDLMTSSLQLPDGGSLYIMLAVADAALPGVLARMQQFERVCLIYDPADYGTLPPRAKSACDPAYLDELRAAGCQVIMMPKVVDLS